MNKHNVVRTAYQILLCSVILFSLVCKRKSELERGIEALSKGDYAKALVSLNAVLSHDSLNQEVLYHLSVAYAHLDSADMCSKHFLKLIELGSPYKDDISLREFLADYLKIEPYASSPVLMKGMNLFKGVFSPDGKTIAVAAAKRDLAQLYLINLDGSIIQKITQRGMNTDPDFSPNGEQIVFVSDSDGDEELYLYTLATGTVEKLTDNKVQDFSPSFSPDGNEIVFVSNRDNIHQWELYMMHVATRNVSRLTRNNVWDGFPRFSSNGAAVVFSSKRNGSEDIYIRDTRGERVLYSSTADDNDPLLINDNLYFKSNIDGEWEIYCYNLKNKKRIRLTYNTYPDWNPRVSKDGTRMIIARKGKQKWQLFFLNLENPVSAEFIKAALEARVTTE